MMTQVKSLIPVLFVAAGLIAFDLSEVTSEREIAIVRRYIPMVNLTGADKDTLVQTGTSLYSGDTLTTDDNGYALVLFLDQSVARVQPRSQLIISGEIDRNQTANTRIDLGRGGIFLNVNRRPNSEFEVITTTTVASVKGTRFGARSTGFYWVEDGEVEVMALQSGQLVMVRSGMFAQADETGTDIVTGQLSQAEMEQLRNEYSILDKDLIERRLILRFRDANGQIIEEGVEYYEQQDN
jgi:hypothetical protein